MNGIPADDDRSAAAAADRGRAALLAAVSHDLRTPLAAAKAAVNGLRSGDAPFTAGDRDELLAAAEESLDQLGRLRGRPARREQAAGGGPAVFPRPADLGAIIVGSLDGFGQRDCSVITDIPSCLPKVMADPAITERIIWNLLSNALRYSSPASRPLLTARTRGDRVELRVVDHGPGIPEADRNRVFLPFCRLGESIGTGVGLGLMVARGLAEAMGAAVTPEETPGGGLTMIVSLPTAPAGQPWS